jgi:hypothetical protein
MTCSTVPIGLEPQIDFCHNSDCSLCLVACTFAAMPSPPLVWERIVADLRVIDVQVKTEGSVVFACPCRTFTLRCVPRSVLAVRLRADSIRCQHCLCPARSLLRFVSFLLSCQSLCNARHCCLPCLAETGCDCRRVRCSAGSICTVSCRRALSSTLARRVVAISKAARFMLLSLSGCVPGVRILRLPWSKSACFVRRWRRLCIWVTAPSTLPLNCPLIWIAIWRQTMQRVLRPCHVHIRSLQGVLLLEDYRALEDL